MDLVEIGHRIKDARERAGLRQKDLADEIGVSVRQLRYYEDGQSRPYDHLEVIAQATGVTREWLLLGGSELKRLEAELAEQRQMIEVLLETIKPGWRELLSPPAGLERLREDGPSNGQDPSQLKTPPAARKPPRS